MTTLPEFPRVCCVCPTYGSPSHLYNNIIACFLRQDYAGPKALIMLDDLGTVSLEGCIEGVRVVSTAARFPSLPAKYNALLRLAGNADVLVVFEVDDLYFPNHLSANVAALRDHEWAYPQKVWSTYDGLRIEQSRGRFHASLAFRLPFLNALGGWTETDKPDFDQQLIRKATQAAPPGQPHDSDGDVTSYVFRWSDTASVHGQSTMNQGDEWYRNNKPQNTEPVLLTKDTVGLDRAAQFVFKAMGISV